jgi:hypothetical protein
MQMPSGAKAAAARSARGPCPRLMRLLPIAVALLLTGCMPATTSQTRGDPADPAARVAPVAYRPTIAPYTRLRPAEPAPWRARNDAAAPPAQPKQ